MNILILLVVAIFIITGTYVGYHASQQAGDESNGHNTRIEIGILKADTGMAQILQNIEPRKSVI